MNLRRDAPKTGVPTERWVALLGHRDFPTDGVEDYCRYLGEALALQGVLLRIARVDWMGEGWLRALWKLRLERAGWNSSWILMQYTALAWSRRGFPFGALLVLGILRRQGLRCAVVYHEPIALKGAGLIGGIRTACQRWILRELHRQSDMSVMTAPTRTIDWLPQEDSKAVFIPIGPNIPAPPAANGDGAAKNGKPLTVAVYCVDPPPYRERELQDIAGAVLPAAKQGTPLRILFFGKGTVDAKDEIEQTFHQTGIEVSILGLLEPGKLQQSLLESDALLSVRGAVYLRRGTAIAGVACGLPIVGYADETDIFPLSEAGLRLVPRGDQPALARALADVLRDPNLREDLRARSRRAHRSIFAWDVIAKSFQEALTKPRALG